MASKECEDVDQLEGMITDLLTSPTLHTPDGMVSATDWVYQAPLQRAQSGTVSCCCSHWVAS